MPLLLTFFFSSRCLLPPTFPTSNTTTASSLGPPSRREEGEEKKEATNSRITTQQLGIRKRKPRENSRRPKRRRCLPSTLGAVANVQRHGLVEGCLEGDSSALTICFHVFLPPSSFSFLSVLEWYVGICVCSIIRPSVKQNKKFRGDFQVWFLDETLLVCE